jgi:hypothetical protein
MVEGRDTVLRKYSADYREAGVEFDYDSWDSYILGLHLASGRRAAAALTKAKMFDPSHPVLSLVGLFGALVAPKAIERRQQQRQLSSYDPSLVADANAWLSRHRTASSGHPYAFQEAK